MFVFTKALKELNRELFTNNNQKIRLKNLEDVKKLDTSNLTDYASELVHDVLLSHRQPLTSFVKDLKRTYNELNKKIKDYNFSKDVNELLDLGYNLVGGAVRDIILDREPKDFDFCTNIPYDQIKITLEKLDYKTTEAGEHFLVVIASKNGNQYEIANYRKDIYNTKSDGRHPSSVQIGTIYEDAERRDLTIGALYYSIDKGLQDPNGTGINDLLSRTLRFVGNPKERIKQDYLRVFRFYRFCKTLGFNPHPKSLRDVRTLFNEAVKSTNPERIKNEIEKICL